MPIHIALLGLNRLGGSLGLALRPREDLRITGFGPDPETTRAAQNRGMLHRSEWNLIHAVEGADLVLLALPLAEQREILTAAAPNLKPGCVITSVAPLLAPPIAWAAELLPADRHFVASHPILNPAHLHSGETGLDAAQADLFARGLWALAPAPACAPEALKLIVDLAHVLGASPYFVDPTEHDGLMSGAGSLPTILAWALMRANAASPGWGEMRKVADRGFATATAALADLDTLLLNRDSVLRYLDAALVELKSLREKIAAGKSLDLEETLAEAAALRAEWLAERQRGDWEGPEGPQVEIPTMGEATSRLFVGGLFGRKKDMKE